MINAIYNICKKFKRCSCDKEYFEVVKVEPKNNSEYTVVLKVVNKEKERGANDGSNQ